MEQKKKKGMCERLAVEDGVCVCEAGLLFQRKLLQRWPISLPMLTLKMAAKTHNLRSP